MTALTRQPETALDPAKPYDKPFATDADRKLLQPRKQFTWKVVVATEDEHLTFEYRSKAYTLQEIVGRFAGKTILEIKRMKRS